MPFFFHGIPAVRTVACFAGTKSDVTWLVLMCDGCVMAESVVAVLPEAVKVVLLHLILNLLVGVVIVVIRV